MIAATAGGAVAGGGATKARRATVASGSRFAFALVTAVAKAEHLVTIIIFREAPNVAAIFSEHPHVEGGITVKLEVQGAPTAQATRAGKRLPTAGQGQAPDRGDLQSSP